MKDCLFRLRTRFLAASEALQRQIAGPEPLDVFQLLVKSVKMALLIRDQRLEDLLRHRIGVGAAFEGSLVVIFVKKESGSQLRAGAGFA